MVFEVNGPVILVTLERQLLELSVGMSVLGASGVLVSGIPTWGRRGSGGDTWPPTALSWCGVLSLFQST